MVAGLPGRKLETPLHVTTVVMDTAVVAGRARLGVRGRRTGQQHPIQGTASYMRSMLR